MEMGDEATGRGRIWIQKMRRGGGGVGGRGGINDAKGVPHRQGK